MTRKSTCSVVICAKNEESTIGEILGEVKGLATEILVVDGASEDRTSDISLAMGCRVLQDDGKGKGFALRRGLAEATGNIVVFLDADGSHQTKDIPLLLAPITAGQADLVIASRVLGGSEEAGGSLYGVLRHSAGVLIAALINLRFGSRITDSQNGFRAIDRTVAHSLRLDEDSFTIEQQMTIRCLRHGFRVVEVPSLELRRMRGTSRLGIMRHGPRFVACLVRELLLRTGRNA